MNITGTAFGTLSGVLDTGVQIELGVHATPQELPVPLDCQGCGAKPSGETPFPACSGCKTARFCNRECQAASWPTHKKICKERQKMLVQQDVTGLQYTPLPPQLQCRYMIEDWVEVHSRVIVDALGSLVDKTTRTFDYRNRLVLFVLQWEPSKGGNPAMAFSLKKAGIIDYRGTLFEPGQKRQLVVVEKLVDDPKSTFLTPVPCAYYVEEARFMWDTYAYLYEQDMPVKVSKDKPFYWKINYCSENGLVYRYPPWPNLQVWTPGVLKKDGNKWVWKADTRLMGPFE